MPLESKNLGLVKAIHVGESAPSNQYMLWFDTVNEYHKYYDFGLDEWLPLKSLTIGQSVTGGSENDILYIDGDGNLASQQISEFDFGITQNYIVFGGADGVLEDSEYFSVSVADKQLNIYKLGLQATDNAGVGIIYQGSNKLIHSYGARNFFAGNAGNLTLTGEDCVFIGNESGFAQGSGDFNTGIGVRSLYGITSGSSNSGFGSFSLYSTQSGSNNVGIGSNAGQHITGSNNVVIGANSTIALPGVGNGNILIGYNLSLTSGTDNYLSIGDTIFGDLANDRIGIGTSTLTSKINLPAATDAAGGILFGTDTNLYRSASNVLKTDDKLIVAGDLDVSTNLAVTGTSTFTANLFMLGITQVYKSLNLTDNGLVSCVAQYSANTQSAAITDQSIYTADESGMYLVIWHAAITRAATSSSTIGHFVTKFTDPTDSIEKSTPTQNNVTASAGNTTAVAIAGSHCVHAKIGTDIKFTVGYASSGATTMQFDVEVRVLKI